MPFEYEFTLTAVNESVFSKQFYSPELTFPEYTDDDKPSYHTFTSEHLDGLIDPREIWARGKFLLALFKGAHIISYQPVYGTYRAANLDLVALYKGQMDITPSDKFAIMPSRTFEQLQGIPFAGAEEWIMHNPVSSMIQVARNNNDAQNILLQIGFGIDWINLYSILDSIRFYSGQQGFKDITAKAGFNKNDVKAFTGTVNNFGLLSVLARHGDTGNVIPPRTLDLENSRSLVLGLARSYFEVVHGIA